MIVTHGLIFTGTTPYVTQFQSYVTSFTAISKKKVLLTPSIVDVSDVEDQDILYAQ